MFIFWILLILCANALSTPLIREMQDVLFLDISGSEDISIDFLLYTRELNKIKHKCKNFYKLDWSIPNCIKDAPLNNTLETKVIIHGWLFHVDQSILSLIPAYLHKSDCNVIFVKWHGSYRSSYSEATDSLQNVGFELANILQNLKDIKGLDFKKVHVIGFSLGAHIAGLAGRKLNGALGRVTGLDPAGPTFQNDFYNDLLSRDNRQIRLNTSAAIFVDVMHTNTAFLKIPALGLRYPVGHIDYYVNGGEIQPTCIEPLRCSHLQAVEYMRQIVKGKKYSAIRCETVKEAEDNNCKGNDTIEMGTFDNPNIYSDHTKNIFYVAI